LDTARQERLNTHLALVLSRLGIPTQAEVIKSGRKSPDLVIYHPLLGAFLGEAEIGNGWADEQAKRKLRERAVERFSDQQFNTIDGILLLIYSRELLHEAASVSDAEVERLFKEYPLGMGLAWRLREPLDPSQWTPQFEWLPQPVRANEIPALFEELLRQKAFMPSDPEQAVRDIEAAIEQVAHYCGTRSSETQWLELWRNVAHTLEIDFEVVKLRSKAEAVRLVAKTFYMLVAVSILVYEVARIRYPNTKKLPSLSTSLSFNELTTCLERLKEINYVEVVDMILPSLRLVSEDPVLVQNLRAIRELIVKHLTPLLRGGSASLAALYQGLLSETYRSAYATFFTKMPAAQLLSELAVKSWEDRVIDPACGTGSLLVSTFLTRQRLAMSSTAAVSALKGESKPFLDALSERLLDNTYGADALRVAAALTSASLTVVSRGLKHERLKVVHTPVGRERAGSLDLMTSNKKLIPSDLLREGEEFTLVIMNPPFTRSDRISQLIGNEARRNLTDAKLTFGKVELQNIFAAGMSKPFLALADRLLRVGGRIAAVLPNSLLSRPSWIDVRRAIAENYTFRYLVVSWAEGAPNFSSDTEFREILVVLEKKVSNDPLTVIHLLKPIDSLKVSDVIKCAHLAKEGGSEVNGTNSPIARVLHIPQEKVRTGHDNLYRLVAFLDDELMNWHLSLIKNCVPFSTLFEVLSVVDHTEGLKEIKGPFDPSKIPQGRYPAVWGSGWEKVRSPILQLIPYLISIESRRRAKVRFWNAPENYQSHLFMLRRGQLDTQGVIAVHSKVEAISNVWWPIRGCYVNRRVIQLFLAFMNSSFGFLHMLAERLETRGLWLEYKKDHLQSLSIPDFTSWVKEIPKEVLSALEKEMPRFDKFLSGMSNIERQLGSWDAAAKHVLQNPGLGHLSPRAELDLFVGYRLSKLYRIRVPVAFYSRLNQEVERLRRIMDSRSTRSEVTRDIGATRIKRPEAPLEWYGEDSSNTN
jgi:predicted RNA methylase